MRASEKTRREFLKLALGGVAGASLAPVALARSRREPIVITPITDTISQVTGAGTNVVIFAKGDQVLMIDGGVAERSHDLLKAIARHTKVRAPQVVFNTHWHWDHTGSNERLGKAGAKIIAHENTKLWLGAEFYVDWEQREYTPRPKIAWPTETFYTEGSLTFAGEEVRYGHLPRAHTDGDLYVFFPAQNVLVAGDLVAVGHYPVLDVATGGWLGGMVDANKALLELTNDETKIVPGTGPLQTRAHLEEQLHMLSTMKDRLVGLMKKGMGTDDLLASPPTEEFNAKWGDPRQFIVNGYRGLWGHVRELGGIV
ncbi:MAG: MBL fold metallo-hydrolase [Steroidobacteraceae bacterium]|nr:MBL fold metallo-hydrolase [Steroidobacteraceae bacterium]